MHKVLRSIAVIVVAVVSVVSLASYAVADSGDGALSHYSNLIQDLRQTASSSSNREARGGSDSRSSDSGASGDTASSVSTKDAARSNTPSNPVAALIQAVVQNAISSNIVVPNASASRVLIGAPSTEQSVKQDEQRAAHIEQIQVARSDASTTSGVPTFPNISQDSGGATGTSVRNFIQTMVQSIGSTSENSRSSVSLPGMQATMTPSRGDTPEIKVPDVQVSEHIQKVNADLVQMRNDTPPQQELKQLEQIGLTIHAISTAKKSVEKQVSAFVADGVNQSVDRAEAQTPHVTSDTGTSTAAFDASKREQKLSEIRTQADEKGQQIANQISQAVLQGVVQPHQIDPVLKSSLQDIAQLVQAESGVSVPAPLGNREVAAKIQAATQNIQENQNALAQRDGLDLYRDSDHDGISDYDEVHIYHTDPNNAYTAGGNLTDGERVLLGLDPHSRSAVSVPVESPKTSGAQTNALFEVTNIALVPQAAAAVVTVASSSVASGVAVPVVATTTATATTTLPAPPQTIRFSGVGLPNSFVTIFVFSTPIVVTVKTDNNGAWTYTLDQSLENGQHEMYVATVDDAGRILAKSPAIPFTKQAEALDYTPLTIQEASNVSPLDILRQNFLVAAGVLLLVFVLIGLLTAGFWRNRTPAI